MKVLLNQSPFNTNDVNLEDKERVIENVNSNIQAASSQVASVMGVVAGPNSVHGRRKVFQLHAPDGRVLMTVEKSF